MAAPCKYWFVLLTAFVAACGGGSADDASCSPAAAITSTPPPTARVGRAYVYSPEWSVGCIPGLTCTGVTLLQGPPGAGVDPIRGIVYWYPSDADVGKSVPFTIGTQADLCGKRGVQSWSVSVSASSQLIKSFSASSVAVPRGVAATLTAVFEGNGQLGGVGLIYSGTPVNVGPIERDTEFTLYVQGDFGETASETILIELMAPPDIRSFGVFPLSDYAHMSRNLSWYIEGQLDSVRLDPGGIMRTGSNAHLMGVDVTPDRTTTYVLTATNKWGSSTATVQVLVEPGP
jgi:hypothetical protein